MVAQFNISYAKQKLLQILSYMQYHAYLHNNIKDECKSFFFFFFGGGGGGGGGGERFWPFELLATGTKASSLRLKHMVSSQSHGLFFLL